ncbi:hypothetical protein HHI36_006599 [Cryptolaemus montrouzieri]|uniref:RING-type E3 ubiquitin transferase n=1 Tax=Cryptolaemus montrouzieri TaxID=559131 RepID=A0ABD2NXP7_9CUCU
MTDSQKGVTEEFECPVCMEYMFPPIHQCTMGHTFCVTCFDKIRRCPTCRCPKGVSRAYALERIHARVTFPCKYKLEGCNEKILGVNLNQHHEVCEFANNPCPFANAMHCRWYGPKSEIIHHCRKVHPTNTQSGNHIILKCPLFDLLGLQSAFYFAIIQAYGEQFQFCWSLSPTGIMKWSMYFMGKASDIKRYKYQISIGKPNGDFEPIIMSANCEQMVEEHDIFEPKYCLLSNYENMRKRCNKNGDLHYEIQIIDKAFENLNKT